MKNVLKVLLLAALTVSLSSCAMFGGKGCSSNKKECHMKERSSCDGKDKKECSTKKDKKECSSKKSKKECSMKKETKVEETKTEETKTETKAKK